MPIPNMDISNFLVFRDDVSINREIITKTIYNSAMNCFVVVGNMKVQQELLVQQGELQSVLQ
jgi:hypothetical protein